MDEMLCYLHVEAKLTMKNLLAFMVRQEIYNLLQSANNEVPCY